VGTKTEKYKVQDRIKNIENFTTKRYTDRELCIGSGSLQQWDECVYLKVINAGIDVWSKNI